MHRTLGVAPGPIKYQLKEVREKLKEKDWRSQVRSFGVHAKRYIKARIPILSWLPTYTRDDFFGDLVAGLTVALLVIPESLAFANLAGLPLEYALYASYIGCFVYVFFGTSSNVTVGPTAIMSLMTAQVLSDLGVPELQKGQSAVILCLMMGIFQVGMGLLKIGFATKYISTAVISGFTSAAAIIILVSQLGHFFGIPEVRKQIYYAIYDIFSELGHARWQDTLLALFCLCMLLGMKVLLSKYGDTNKVLWLVCTSRNSLVILIACIISVIVAKVSYDWSEDTSPLTVLGHLKRGLASPSAPPLTGNKFEEFWVGGFVLALVGYLESLAIAKTFAKRTDYRFRVEANQELIALGMCSILGSFFHSYPTTGSFSRTAVNAMSGSRTPANGIVTGTLVVIAAYTMTNAFQFIPEAAIAAVIIASVVMKIDVQMFIYLWRVNVWDLLTFTVCFFVTLFAGIQYGILFGLGINLLIRLYWLALPRMAVLGRHPDRPFAFVPLAEFREARQPRGVLVFQVQEALLFSNAAYVRDSIFKIERGRFTRSLSSDSLNLDALGISTQGAQRRVHDVGYAYEFEYRTLMEDWDPHVSSWEVRGGLRSRASSRAMSQAEGGAADGSAGGAQAEQGQPGAPPKRKSNGNPVGDKMRRFSDFIGKKRGRKGYTRNPGELLEDQDGLSDDDESLFGADMVAEDSRASHSAYAIDEGAEEAGPSESAAGPAVVQVGGGAASNNPFADGGDAQQGANPFAPEPQQTNPFAGEGDGGEAAGEDPFAALAKRRSAQPQPAQSSEGSMLSSLEVRVPTRASAASSDPDYDPNRMRGPETLRSFVFDMSCVNDIDVAGIDVLRDLLVEFVSRDVAFCIAGAKPHVIRMLQNVAFLESVGTLYFFDTVSDAVIGCEDRDLHHGAVTGAQVYGKETGASYEFKVVPLVNLLD